MTEIKLNYRQAQLAANIAWSEHKDDVLEFMRSYKALAGGDDDRRASFAWCIGYITALVDMDGTDFSLYGEDEEEDEDEAEQE